MNAREILAAMPGDALVPVKWVRELFAVTSAESVGLTVEELAEKTGRSPSTVRAWCRRGELPGAYQLGGSWRIPASAFAERQKAIDIEPSEPAPANLAAWRVKWGAG